MHQVHSLGPGHNDIPDSRNNECTDIMLYTIFHDLIAFMAVNAAQKNNLRLCQGTLEIFGIYPLHIHGIDNLITPVKTIFTDQAFKSFEFIPYQNGFTFFKSLKIPFMCTFAPCPNHQILQNNGKQNRQNIGNPSHKQHGNKIHQTITDNHR